MGKAQLKSVRDGSTKPKPPLAKAGEMDVGTIGKLVKGKEAEELASAAVVQQDPAVRKAAIKGLITLGSIPGLKFALKESDVLAEAKMAAYALMTLDCRGFVEKMANKGDATVGTVASLETLAIFWGRRPGGIGRVISSFKAQGDTRFLKAIAMLSSDKEMGNAAIKALRELDGVDELDGLLVEVRSALNGQKTSIGIVESAKQLERGIEAVAALEELGALEKLQMNAKGICFGPDAQELRGTINEAISRLQ